MAVAVGFEPTEGDPSRAFEARSFGRSDTLPPVRIPDPAALLSSAASLATSRAPHTLKQLRALLGEHPAVHLQAVIQPAVPHDVP